MKLVHDKLVDRRREQLLIVELRDADTQRPLMILPLLRIRKRGYSTIEWLSCGVCDYAAPLLATDVPWSPHGAALAWQAIRKVLPKVDLIQIDAIPSEIAGVPNPLGMLTMVDVSPETTCGLGIDGDPETVLERCCKPSYVHKLGKTGRRLAKRGPVSLVEARSESEVDEIYAVLLAQRRSRFSKLGRFDLLKQAGVAGFYRSAAVNGLSGGAVRLLGLRVGDTWVGTYYGLLHHDVFQGVIVTIADESWRTCSPGLHVHAHVIKWARRQGATYFDMSVGALAYKDEIGGRRSRLLALREAVTLRGTAILVARRIGLGLKGRLQKHPTLYGVLRRLRRRLRRAAGTG